MPIKDQCLRCKQYDAHSDFCNKQQQNPIYNNSSCSYYVSRTINLEKGSSNVVPTQIPTPIQPSSSSSNQIGENSQPQSTPTGLKRFFSFEGRIGRGEYWLSYIVYNLFCLPMNILEEDEISGSLALIWLLLLIPMLWMIIAQGAKRCHDRGNSGWFQIIPFYGLWMAFAPGDDGPNEYGVRS
ncbi:MAG: DUF805 domain-containing protein [Paludibacteraceae bacterium]|nr:DUF805 domain-containing protein [Paludibacteraceae bacterium]